MLFYLYIIISYGLLIYGYLQGDSSWWMALINSYRYWLFVPAIIFWIEKLWNGIENLQALLLVLLTGAWIYFYVFFPFYEAFDKSKTPQFVGQPLKIMTFNILYKNGNYPLIVNAVQKGDPDIISFQETTATQAQQLKDSLKEQFPYMSFKSIKEAVGVTTFSKIPLDSVQFFNLGVGQAQFMRVKTESRAIYLVNVHTESINPLDVFGEGDNIIRAYKQREKMIKSVIDGLSASNIPLSDTVFVGDFNSTEGNDLYKLMKSAGFSDTYRSVNPILFNSFTFPHNMLGLFDKPGKFYPLLRLDYIYTGSRFKTLKSTVVGGETGSDHLPVVSTVAMLN